MLRVLLLDGYDESRERTGGVLRDAGYDVVPSAEEDDAVRALDQQAVDIVLFDLPLDEAEEAAVALRQSAHGGEPVFVALADPTLSRSRRDEGRAKGIDYFFLRPCPPAEIVKHLRRLR